MLAESSTESVEGSDVEAQPCSLLTDEDPIEVQKLIEGDRSLTEEELRIALANERRCNHRLKSEVESLKNIKRPQYFHDFNDKIQSLFQQLQQLGGRVDTINSELDHLRSKSRSQVKKFDIDEYANLNHNIRDIERRLEIEIPEQKEEFHKFEDSYKEMTRMLDDIEVKYAELANEKVRIDMLIDTLTEQSRTKRWLKDERFDHLWQVSLYIRVNFRNIFGSLHFEKCGHFLDKQLAKIVHNYAYDVSYVPMTESCLEDHKRNVFAAVVSEDGCYLYTGSADKFIILWDLRTNKVVEQWEAHSAPVECLAYHSGLLVSGGWDNMIHLWAPFTHELSRTLESHNDYVVSVNFSKDGEELISSSRDRTICVWSVSDGECLRTFAGHTKSVPIAYFIDDVIISGSADQSIKIWNPSTAEDYRTVTDGINAAVTHLCFNCDRTLIACMSSYSSTIIYGWPSLEIVSILIESSLRGCFHPFYPHLLALSDGPDHLVKIFDVTNAECIFSFRGHTKNVSHLCFTPDGQRLISSSDDSNIRVWDVSFLAGAVF